MNAFLSASRFVASLIILSVLLIGIAMQTLTEPAYAQISEFKITASDGAAADRFGYSVSISGDYAVVGAYYDDDNGSFSGSAYVFKRTDTTWTQEAKLLPSDGAAEDFFGRSVSISGDYAVVGANFDDDNGAQSGSAYVFKRTGTSWTQEAKLLPSDGAANDMFGFSVSISGDYAVVGSANDDNGQDAGSAYVFKRTGTSWTQEAKLLPADGAANDVFGFSVYISGDYAVMGARWDDDNGGNSGSAYVFKRTGTSWAQEAKLLASDGAAFDEFGVSVSISGDYAVVGAWRDDDNGTDAGSAYVFKRNGTSWAQEAKLLPSGGAADDWFGNSVSISGDYAVVGAYLDDGYDLGSAYLFKRTGISWAEEAKLLASDGAIGDLFGSSVSISGDYAVVGAVLDNDNGNDAGSAYLYNLDNDNGNDAGSAYLYNGFISLGVLSVSIPESFGEPGDTLWVPINVSNTDDLGIISSEYRLTYDTSFASILGPDFQQTMPDAAGWMVEYNVKPGSLWVAMSGDNPINGAGVLSKVQFAVKEDAVVGSGTQLILSPFLFNEGNPTAQVINGSITAGSLGMSLSTDSISFDSVPAGDTETIIQISRTCIISIIIIQYSSHDGIVAGDGD